jgi:LRR receptor-like serine/threonine-protein kinase ERECTA
VPLHLKRIPSNSKLNSLILSSTGQWSTKGISNAKAIQSLHLTDNGLTGTFPEEILKLTKLTSLFLSFNSFNGTIPTHISKLSNLEEFYAFGNKFIGTLPNESISKLTKLREFIIPNNFLSGKVPSSFNNLATLEQLSLYDQHSSSLMTGTIPSFLNAPRLWYFDVSNNHLTGSIPPDFMLHSVQRNDSVTVYLSNNDITGDIPTQLRSFEALDLLIVGNKITSLTNDFCSKNSWMQNDVGKIGSCNAVGL